jgi:amino acid permease
MNRLIIHITFIAATLVMAVQLFLVMTFLVVTPSQIAQEDQNEIKFQLSSM